MEILMKEVPVTLSRQHRTDRLGHWDGKKAVIFIKEVEETAGRWNANLEDLQLLVFYHELAHARQDRSGLKNLRLDMEEEADWFAWRHFVRHVGRLPQVKLEDWLRR